MLIFNPSDGRPLERLSTGLARGALSQKRTDCATQLLRVATIRRPRWKRQASTHRARKLPRVVGNLDQRLRWNAESLMQSPDHLEAQWPPAIQYLIYPVPTAEILDQIFRL